MAKITLDYKNRTFEIKAHPDFRGAMICCDIFEVVHPTSKFFRTRYCKHSCFWTNDFSSVLEGVKFCLADFVEEEEADRRNYEKFAEFEKKCLTN